MEHCALMRAPSEAVVEGPDAKLDIAPLVSAFGLGRESFHSEERAGLDASSWWDARSCFVHLGSTMPYFTSPQSWQDRPERDPDVADRWEECFDGDGPESQETVNNGPTPTTNTVLANSTLFSRTKVATVRIKQRSVAPPRHTLRVRRRVRITQCARN